jgi:yecA family protein
MIGRSEVSNVCFALNTERVDQINEAIFFAMGAIMERYNEIVRGFQENPLNFDPVFWETKDGLVIAADWAEGFYDAINLRTKAWKPLFQDRTSFKLMKPIMILCGKQEGASDLSPSA